MELLSTILRPIKDRIELFKSSLSTLRKQLFFYGLLQVIILLLTAPKVSAQTSFYKLFTGSPKWEYGEAGCQKKHNAYNSDWQSYFSHTDSTITITAGDDCRTVNTGSNNACVFDLGTGGITGITFDFDISGDCHTATYSNSSDCPTIQSGTINPWLAFWMYTNPWSGTAEVDFIESNFGPGCGLNINFDGNPTQKSIFSPDPDTNWKGSIQATFETNTSPSDTTVTATITAITAGGNIIGTGTLTRSTGYFFVLDTSLTTTAGCTVTITNLSMTGTVPSGQCSGIVTAND